MQVQIAGSARYIFKSELAACDALKKNGSAPAREVMSVPDLANNVLACLGEPTFHSLTVFSYTPETVGEGPTELLQKRLARLAGWRGQHLQKVCELWENSEFGAYLFWQHSFSRLKWMAWGHLSPHRLEAALHELCALGVYTAHCVYPYYDNAYFVLNREWAGRSLESRAIVRALAENHPAVLPFSEIDARLGGDPGRSAKSLMALCRSGAVQDWMPTDDHLVYLRKPAQGSRGRPPLSSLATTVVAVLAMRPGGLSFAELRGQVLKTATGQGRPEYDEFIGSLFSLNLVGLVEITHVLSRNNCLGVGRRAPPRRLRPTTPLFRLYEWVRSTKGSGRWLKISELEHLIAESANRAPGPCNDYAAAASCRAILENFIQLLQALQKEGLIRVRSPFVNASRRARRQSCRQRPQAARKNAAQKGLRAGI